MQKKGLFIFSTATLELRYVIVQSASVKEMKEFKYVSFFDENIICSDLFAKLDVKFY